MIHASGADTPSRRSRPRRWKPGERTLRHALARLAKVASEQETTIRRQAEQIEKMSDEMRVLKSMTGDIAVLKARTNPVPPAPTGDGVINQDGAPTTKTVQRDAANRVAKIVEQVEVARD